MFLLKQKLPAYGGEFLLLTGRYDLRRWLLHAVFIDRKQFIDNVYIEGSLEIFETGFGRVQFNDLPSIAVHLVVILPAAAGPGKCHRKNPWSRLAALIRNGKA